MMRQKEGFVFANVSRIHDSSFSIMAGIRLKKCVFFFSRNGTLLATSYLDGQFMAHAHSRRRNRTECDTKAS